MVTHLSPTFNFQMAEYEDVSCNLCGRHIYQVVATRDQNGLSVQTRRCEYCGLIYISPRMKKEWYAKYYEEEYRIQRARRKGNEALIGSGDLGLLDRKSERFGAALANLVARYVLPGLTIEVGSSTGGVLAAFAKRIPGVVPLGIEPSPFEAAYAEARGIKTRVLLLEDVTESFPPAANIICVRTLNHLLDPHKFFHWAYDNLLPNGKLILAVLDFRHSVKKRGSFVRAIQIDHVFMFTAETLRAFVESAGFDVEFFDVNEGKSFRELELTKLAGLTGQHLRLVARKSDRAPFRAPIPALGRDIARSLRWSKIIFYFITYRLYCFSARCRRISKKYGITA